MGKQYIIFVYIKNNFIGKKHDKMKKHFYVMHFIV